VSHHVLLDVALFLSANFLQHVLNLQLFILSHSIHTKFHQDTVTGFLLAGVGHRTADSCNFLTVKQDTKPEVVESTLKAFTQRDDIGIILINQHVANDLRHILKDYNQTIPTILEIPSKEHPYDPEQDFIMQRVNMFLGGGA
jgi:V-type H+-transporting ATPase subunit F